MNSYSGDVAIVGAGIIGLSVAFELAGRGATVRVFDRDEPARAASWAAGGMLAPYSEAVDDEAMLALCETSLTMYPAFVERIRERSGIDPKLRIDGSVNAAFDDRQREHIEAHAAGLRARGIACDVLDRAQTIAEEPFLGSNVRASLLVPSEGCVDNRRLGRALHAAALDRGVLVAHVRELAVECDGRRVLGVRTERGFATAGVVVNACGAWAAQLPGIPSDFVVPVEPVKGQMLALAAPSGLVRRTTWVPGAYLIPRDDGRLLIGASAEREGFDTRVTAGAIRDLLDAALNAAPSLRGLALVETWTGLRPGTPDGRPFIGRTDLDGYVLATGHYRNGILLAPVTGRLVAEAVEGAPESEAFGLGRLISRL